jgi:hypothetical protein
VRVGRGPLDEEAIRLIEASNPDLEFDWTRILKGQSEPPPVERREVRSEGKDRNRRPGPDRRKTEEPKPVPESEAEPFPEVAEATGVEEPTSPAHSRLGSEGLARLRARYSEMLARIDERVTDPEQQSELKSLAERLNPDAWLTDDDVTAGLESYEATFATLRAAIPSRRA